LFSAYICGFKVKERVRKVTARKTLEIPFEVHLRFPGSGEGVIQVKEGHDLDYEKRNHYRFYVVAEDCGTPPKESDRFVDFLFVCLF
jgi:hypothetical protein